MIVGSLIATLAAGPVAGVYRAQAALVVRYMNDLQQADFAGAFRLLNPAERAYFRNADNYRSVYVADGFHVRRFTIVRRRTGLRGGVYFVRETARFRDHAHDIDLLVTATIPIGVVALAGGWRIKDPGHPWRAFAANAVAERDGLRIRVKKLSFFARRIEAVITFQNRGSAFVTVLPYAKSILRDADGSVYPIVETRDWALTDKVLFEGLRLAPNAEYTGSLSFTCGALDDRRRRYLLTVAPILFDGADLPFSLDVAAIAAGAP